MDKVLYGSHQFEVNRNPLKKKADQIKESIKSRLEISQAILIQGSLNLMRFIQERIDELDGEISARIRYRKNNLAIAVSVPGTGFVSATAILAKIGNYTDFEKARAVCRMVWHCSFFISVRRKDHPWMDRQTRLQAYSKSIDSSRYAISRTRDSKLKKFFLRIQTKKRSKVAVVVLARKVLYILHHLLMNQEMYIEYRDKKNVRRKPLTPPSPIEMPIREMIDGIVRAGYVITKCDKRCGFV